MIANVENKSMDMEVRDINMFLPAYIRSYLFVSKNESPDKIIFPMFPTVPHPHDPSKRIPVEYYPMDSPIVAGIIEDGQDVKEATEAELDARDAQEDRIKELETKLAHLETEGQELQELKKDVEGRGGVVGTEEAGRVVKPLDELTVGELDKVAEAMLPAPEDLLRQQQEAEIKDEPEPPPKVVQSKATTKPGLAPAREPKHPDVVIAPGTPLDNMASRDRGDQTRVAKDIKPEPEVDEDRQGRNYAKIIGRDEKGKPTVKGGK